MNITDVELDGGTIRSLREPEIQILTILATLKEEDVVAGVEIGEGVERTVVVVGGFRVEFRVFESMWEQGVKVCEEMSVAGRTSVSKERFLQRFVLGTSGELRDNGLPERNTAGCEH